MYTNIYNYDGMTKILTYQTIFKYNYFKYKFQIFHPKIIFVLIYNF